VADAWDGAWGSAWGVSWGTGAVAPPVAEDYNPTNIGGTVRMYGSGGVYRPRDEDVADILKLLFRVRKKKAKRREKVKEFEDAAMLLLNQPTPEVRRIVVDYAGKMMGGQARQAELQTMVQAMLELAAQEAERARLELEEDDDDVLMLLGAL
jgi:23S rRNA G2069 N7-methylase RlmK/C1962 C5-methylase RlmI